MKRPIRQISGAAAVLAAVLTLGATSAAAAPLLVNGGFESGFSGWTRLNQLGSEGTFALQTGVVSPVNGDPVPAPPGGVAAAMSDAFGPGSHVLYQDFVIPAGTLSGTASFSVFVGNGAGAFSTPATLDFSTPTLNQQARVDIIRTTADPFSVAAADVLMNLFQTIVGSPLVTGYNTVTVNLSSLLAANAGSTLRLRFAEVDNVFTFQFGVDNVNLDASATAVPEPATMVLMGMAMAGAMARRKRVA
jgi:PEP-CTERM motif